MSGPHFVRAGLLSLILFCPACLYGCAAATAPLWDGVQFCPAWCNVRAACWHDQQQAIYFSNTLVIAAQLHAAAAVTPTKPPTLHCTATLKHAAAALVRNTQLLNRNRNRLLRRKQKQKHEEPEATSGSL